MMTNLQMTSIWQETQQTFFRKYSVSVWDPNINEFITTLDVQSILMTPRRRSFIIDPDAGFLVLLSSTSRHLPPSK